MPRIRRWFHVSHDINSDPEVWEMRDRFGERSLGVWLEILSIADRHDGLVPGDNKYLSSTLAGKCKTKTTKVEGILLFATEKQWLVYDPIRRVRNHLKYRPTRGAKQIPEGEQSTPPPLPSPPLPSSPFLSSSLSTSPSTSKALGKNKSRSKTSLNGFHVFWERYPRKEGIGKAEEAWRKHAEGVPIDDILGGIARWEQSEKWAEGFLPMPATWLNQKRWRDTPLLKSKRSRAQCLWDEAQREKEAKK